MSKKNLFLFSNPEATPLKDRLILGSGAVILGSFLLWASARFQVPFYPVPMTMQTLAVMLIAATYKRNLALASLMLYLSIGLLGFPVFSGTPEKGIGLAYILGPTGGYLIGFILATISISFLMAKNRTNSWVKNIAIVGIGDIIIFTCGWLWLSNLIGFKAAFTFGVVPFVLGDILKIFIAGIMVTKLKPYRLFPDLK